MVMGWILIVIGALYLLREMGFIEGSFWGYLIPVLFILLGISMVTKGRGSRGKNPQVQ